MAGLKMSAKGNVNVGTEPATRIAKVGTGKGVRFSGRGNVVVSTGTAPTKITSAPGSAAAVRTRRPV
jgi:uncharacterized protein (AIM24 family)